MHPDLAFVRDLQEVDRRIAELIKEIGYLPKHIAEIESRLEGHRRKLEEDRAALAANQKSRRGLEDDIKTFEGKISKLREQMGGAKTNEQYRAFQHEIEFAQGEIRKQEDRILEHMAEAEALEKNVKAAEAALKLENAEVEKEKKIAQQQTDSDRAELDQAQAQRASVASSLTRPTLANYERVRRSRGNAVAQARDGRCTACNVILRLHFYQHVRKGDEIFCCEACGRLLYFLPPQEPPKEIVDCTSQTADHLRSPS